jgi:ATP-binding protein involved in chromosome partitioning
MIEEKVRKALSGINEPVLKRDFISLDFLKSISINGKNLKVTLGLSSGLIEGLRNDLKSKIAEEIKKSAPEIDNVEVVFTLGVSEHKHPKKTTVLPEVKNTIAVASGKGGVGKSTVTVNLAAALKNEGAKVGIIDADIYGPSIPLMMGIKEKPKVMRVDSKNKLLPVEKFGIKVMSIGFLMEEGSAVVWRGPMASSALKQFMSDVIWDKLDYLLFDMPPGTGDIQLTLSQTIPLTGAVIVTTPQDISLADAKKGHIMFQKVNVPTLGIIENMSYFINSDGKKEYIFGQGGGEKMSSEYGVKLLGEIPINTRIRESGDEGIPIVFKDDNLSESKIYREIAGNLVKEINLINTSKDAASDIEIEL